MENNIYTIGKLVYEKLAEVFFRLRLNQDTIAKCKDVIQTFWATFKEIHCLSSYRDVIS